jgi:hypothetical protein
MKDPMKYVNAKGEEVKADSPDAQFQINPADPNAEEHIKAIADNYAAQQAKQERREQKLALAVKGDEAKIQVDHDAANRATNTRPELREPGQKQDVIVSQAPLVTASASEIKQAQDKQPETIGSANIGARKR